MTAQMTPWFPPEIKPMRLGKYRTRVDFGIGPIQSFMFWNGANWLAKQEGYVLQNQNRHWRGLAADPAVTK